MGSLFLMRKKLNLLSSFLMFFGASVFQFLISFGAFFITGGVQVHHLTPKSILHISIFVPVRLSWGSSLTLIFSNISSI